MVYFVTKCRDYVRGGSEGALAPPEFGGSGKRTERETDNLLIIAPPKKQNPNIVPLINHGKDLSSQVYYVRQPL